MWAMLGSRWEPSIPLCRTFWTDPEIPLVRYRRSQTLPIGSLCSYESIDAPEFTYRQKADYGSHWIGIDHLRADAHDRQPVHVLG